MQTEAIINTLLRTATYLKNSAPEIADRVVQDGYSAVKDYLAKKFAQNADAAKALEMATAKPESVPRRTLLVEECSAADLGNDAQLAELIQRLAPLIPQPVNPFGQHVRVTGDRNILNVAGRDLIHTRKFIHRNAINPDETHLNAEEREHVQALVPEVAERISHRSASINFGAVHRMMRREFGVASYLLIPRGRYKDAIHFLKERWAMFRNRLRRCDPAKWQNELYRAIFAGAREIGWSGERVYQFAGEKIGTNAAIASLKNLNLVQLKALADSIQNEARKHRLKQRSSTHG